MRIALKESKETRFRLRVCRRCDLLDARFDALVAESDELVKIPASIVHSTIRRRAAAPKSRRKPNGRGAQP
jgi:hypothetical protein